MTLRQLTLLFSLLLASLMLAAPAKAEKLTCNQRLHPGSPPLVLARKGELFEKQGQHVLTYKIVFEDEHAIHLHHEDGAGGYDYRFH